VSARRSLWLATLLAAAPAEAFATDMCAALDRIAVASRERVPFASLAQAARDGTLVPGYRGGDCLVRPRAGVTCWRNLAPEQLEPRAVERAVRDCLGRAPVLDPGRQPRNPDEADLVFVARGLRYEFDTECSPRCAAGMLASLGIRLDGARPGRAVRPAR
jgi:hypothetical protein